MLGLVSTPQDLDARFHWPAGLLARLESLDKKIVRYYKIKPLRNTMFKFFLVSTESVRDGLGWLGACE